MEMVFSGMRSRNVFFMNGTRERGHSIAQFN